MAVAGSTRPRVSVDGKFFRLGGKKFFVAGVSYGPFEPNAAGQAFASPEQTAGDFEQIRSLNANVVRVFQVPPRWFLDLAMEHGLKVLVDLPWSKNVCFLDSAERRAEAKETVRRAVYACARHPAVFAFSIANEIPPDVVRWSGAGAVADFIDELVLEAKRIDPECLCTYTNFPPTEFLHPQSVDFISFNVYLHQRPAFRHYLARLQLQADSKPLLLGEIGIDSLREGEQAQASILSWQIEDSFREGLAGCVVFTYTDDWWPSGERVDDWQMGLTTRDRQPKPAFAAVQKQFQIAPEFPLRSYPKVSVVVASYNGERTLRPCLESLDRLNYPNYEVILVDDGSVDATRQVASLHPEVRYIRHNSNLGLSAARNSGIAAATGEIVAFTDSDCRADEDWLRYLVGVLQAGDYVGVGGPNLLPPEDSPVAAAVMASPGGPAHVMLTDDLAEHIPGCNMAFYKSALDEIGRFDPIYRKAGDDVDVCWRLQQAGYRIGFCPAAFVWHYRRSTVAAYLKQQHGYGEAEALLVQKHPEYFNLLGGSMWRGRIYTTSPPGLLARSVIYRGLFGSAGFQSVYTGQPEFSHFLVTSLEYHLLLSLPVWILSLTFPVLVPVALASTLLSLGVCGMSALRAKLPRNRTLWWSRPLVALLFFLQPIVRGWARYQGRKLLSTPGPVPERSLDSIALRDGPRDLSEAHFASRKPFDRVQLVRELVRRLEERGWPHRTDKGWSDFDLEIYGSRWSKLQLITAAEDHVVLCCRLLTQWSLQAKALLGVLFGVDLLIIGLFASEKPWLWLLLLTLPLCVWFVYRDERNLQSVTQVLLQEFAAERGFQAIERPRHPSRRPEKSPAAEETPAAETQATTPQ